MRAQILAHAANARLTADDVAEMVGCSRAHVYRVVRRFGSSTRQELFDGRRDSGRRIADQRIDVVVREIVAQSPLDFGYPRPTWTRELLSLVTEEKTAIRLSLTTMTRVLQRIGARRGRPKPTVKCPLSKRQKRRRLARIRSLIAHLPLDEGAVYEDEADIHLNPKIGLDWMPRGVQKEVLTPGQNQKAYIAGTLDVRDGKVLWVGAEKKNSGLFIQMLERLDEHYKDAKLIHVILDNCAVHRSSETSTALRWMPRIRLHFLPPYCPDHNRIERLWQDLHANVTRNHRHRTLSSLCPAVADWLDAASPWPSTKRAAEPQPRGLAQRSTSRLLAKPGESGAQPTQESDDRLALAA